MLRRVAAFSTPSSVSLKTSSSSTRRPTTPSMIVSRRWNADGSSFGPGSNNNSPDSHNSDIAGRILCDTADGVYAAMMMSGAATATSTAATRSRGTRSIFGDSPAAVATSLMGCFFFATTYGYYIGGAVKEAALSKFASGVEESSD